jgi:hypothetical protein
MNIHTGYKFILFLCLTVLLLITQTTPVHAQGFSKWLRISNLHAYIQDYGVETETDANTYMGAFSWPAAYGLDNYSVRAKGLFLGCKDFNDPVSKVTYPYKVVALGPRGSGSNFRDKIFIQQFKMVGRYNHPAVYVNQEDATINTLYDAVDEIDPTLVPDRMVVTQNNTNMGITLTRKVMAFTNPYIDNFFVYDYVFKNTGIYDAAGDVNPVALDSVYFYFAYRYSLAGDGRLSSGSVQTDWLPQYTRWGGNTLNQSVGHDPSAASFKYRAQYSCYGPVSGHVVGTGAGQDWGAPNDKVDGELAAGRYVGCVTLHADKSATDKTDDLYQPKTTAILQSDATAECDFVTSEDYTETKMTPRYRAASAGHDAVTNFDAFKAAGATYANTFNGQYPQGGGGNQATQGYGPYQMAPGDSIHIVFAEGIAGLSREKMREVGGNWFQWSKSLGTPALTLPDGSTATDYNAYKDAWVFTCEDSIKQMFQRALDLYNGNYNMPQPPPAPEVFNVTSGGDKISLSWGNSARSWPTFNGYVVYRSKGNVLLPQTVYEKIFECDKSNATEAFDDVTALRGFDYYYYVQTKDDGSTNTIQPGVPMVSSMFLTVTSKAANLLKPSKSTLDSVRVVPNPYMVKARALQFGDPITGFDRDRIMFFGLVGKCTIRIFTERGDLIWEKEHTSGSGDEQWNCQTKYGQVLVSGIYIAHFQTPDGKSIFRKFVVIR